MTFSQLTKIISKYIDDSNIRAEALKILKEITEEKFLDIDLGKISLDII